MAYIEDSNDIPAFAGGARVEDYFALLKPRVMSLVVFTAIVGLLLAPGGIHPVLGFIAILSIAIGAGGSGALNMWYDSDIDAIMSRTANRPIPAGRIERDHALALGLVLSAFSVCLLGLATNWLAAGLLAWQLWTLDAELPRNPFIRFYNNHYVGMALTLALLAEWVW